MYRPLRIGEIFDRAVTLCVTNFVPFAIIALFYIVPLAVGNIFQQRDTVQAWGQLLGTMRGHPSSQPAIATNWGLQIAIFGFVALAAPLIYSAIAVAIAQLYRGETVEWRSALLFTLKRWFAIIGLTFIGVMLVASAVFAGSLVLGIIIGLSAVVATASKAAAITFGVVGVLLLIAWLLVLLVLAIAVFFMYFALVIEGAPFLSALSSGFTRIFNRKELHRALAMGLAFFAVQIGLAIVGYTIVAVLDIWLHVFVIGALVLSAVNLIAALFLAAVFTVYYFDVRIRREALDVQAGSQPFVPITQS